MTFLKPLAAVAALVGSAGVALAETDINPAVIFDLGGKFDRSFNQASSSGVAILL